MLCSCSLWARSSSDRAPSRRETSSAARKLATAPEAEVSVLPRLEALATLRALAVSMSLMALLTYWTGFSRLLGLEHVA